jgi:hypothetical protein
MRASYCVHACVYAHTLQIVDAESCEELQEDVVGEIWIRSESKVCLTYTLLSYGAIYVITV